MNREESNPFLFDGIPTAIVCDILSRLPTKTSINCKLVCKEWCRIIVSPEFAELRRACDSYFSLLFFGKFCSSGANFVLLDLDKNSYVNENCNLSVSVDAMIRFKCEFTYPKWKLHLVNECNGLICLKTLEIWGPYIICNPLTGQFVIVKQSPKPFHFLLGYGLGCCPVTHQFKVLRILMTKFKYVAEIQTLGTDEWRTIDDAQTCNGKIGAFLHGSLHWYTPEDHSIWSFQLGNEKFVRVPVPEHTKGSRATEVTVFDSHLCFSCISNDSCQRDIWLMKEYGMKESWVKQFVMKKGEYGLLYVPLLRFGSGKILVSFRGRCNLLVYDLQSETYKQVKVHGVPSFELVACDMKLSALYSCIQCSTEN